MEMDQIIKLIQEVSNSNLLSFKYTEDNLSLELSKVNNAMQKNQQFQDMNQSNLLNEDQVINKNDERNNAISKDKVTEKDISDKFIIKSPIVGTFYSSPSEESQPYIEVGDRVKKGQVIAIIEAMKIMNEIEATADGVVHKILVKDQDIVEFGQPLVVIC